MRQLRLAVKEKWALSTQRGTVCDRDGERNPRYLSSMQVAPVCCGDDAKVLRIRMTVVCVMRGVFVFLCMGLTAMD